MFKSYEGKVFGRNENGLLFNGRPIGNFAPAGPRGKVFFVDSQIDATEGTSPDTAVGTLDEAFALTTANQGDVIYVLPNHAETVTGAGGVTHDVAGVSVIGLGVGNQRPRILLDGGTAVTYLISAADAYVSGLELASGHAAVVTAVDVTAVNAHLENIKFSDNTTSEYFLNCVKASGAANTADGLTITNCKYTTVEAATDFFTHTNAVDRLKINDNVYIADAATTAGFILSATTKILTNLECLRNYFVCGNTSTDIFIDNDASTNTGIVAWNMVGHHDVAGAVIIDCDGVRLFQNYQVSSDTESGVLVPAADTNT